MTDREALARIIDPEAMRTLEEWHVYYRDGYPDWTEDARKDKAREGHTWPFIEMARQEALAKAEAWLARPSPVDGLVKALRGFVLVAKGQGLNLGPLIADGDAALTAYDQALKGETK